MFKEIALYIYINYIKKFSRPRNDITLVHLYVPKYPSTFYTPKVLKVLVNPIKFSSKSPKCMIQIWLHFQFSFF